MELSGLIEGRFKLLGPLGKDEIGATFLVEDQDSGKQVALRRLRPSIVFDADLNEVLLKGFERAQSLVHPHIGSVNEFLKQDDSHGVLIVMEYVPGETLRDFLFKQANYRCDEATFIGLAEQILSAMEHAHQAGMTHRDITPDNVLITTKGAVKVIDFGIDAIVKEANFRRWDNPIFLSTYYVSPEEVAGEEPSPSMDIYSLGCLFYEMLAGKLPFNERDIVNRQPEDRAESIPGVSELLNSLILQCMASEKTERPQSVAEIQNALAGHDSPTVSAPEPVAASAPSPASPVTPDLPGVTNSRVEELSPPQPTTEDPRAEARVLSREILEEAAPDEEGVPDEDLPFRIVEKKGSSRRVVLIGGILILIGAALWWYQSGLPTADPPAGVTEGVEDLQEDESEEPVVKEIPPQQPEEVAPASSSIPDGAAQAPDAGGLRPPGASLSDGFTIQVGAFGTEAAARRVLLQLSGKSFAGRIEPPGTGADGLYRVSVGNFAGRNEASQLQNRLKADGFSTFIKQVTGR